MSKRVARIKGRLASFGAAGKSFARSIRGIRRIPVRGRKAKITALFIEEVEKLNSMYSRRASSSEISNQQGKVLAHWLSSGISARELERMQGELAKKFSGLRTKINSEINSALDEVIRKPPTTKEEFVGVSRTLRQKLFLQMLVEPKGKPFVKEALPWFDFRRWRTKEGRGYIGWRTATLFSAWGDLSNALPFSQIFGGAGMAFAWKRANRAIANAERIGKPIDIRAEEKKVKQWAETHSSDYPAAKLKLAGLRDLQRTHRKQVKVMQKAERAKILKQRIVDFRTFLTLNPFLQADYWLLFSPIMASMGISEQKLTRLNRAFFSSINSLNNSQIRERERSGKKPTLNQRAIRRFLQEALN